MVLFYGSIFDKNPILRLPRFSTGSLISITVTSYINAYDFFSVIISLKAHNIGIRYPAVGPPVYDSLHGRIGTNDQNKMGQG